MMNFHEVIFLDEIDMVNHSEYVDKSYRISGFMEDIDYVHKCCLLKDNKYEIYINCTLIDMNLCKLDGLFQIFGMIKLNRVRRYININIHHVSFVFNYTYNDSNTNI